MECVWLESADADLVLHYVNASPASDCVWLVAAYVARMRVIALGPRRTNRRTPATGRVRMAAALYDFRRVRWDTYVWSRAGN